jgi:hypothetical protein
VSDFGEGKTVRTRRPHRCEWCYQAIDSGSECYHYKGMWEGDWQDWYMHHECKEVYSLNGDQDGFMPGEGERPVRCEVEGK